MAVCGNAGWVHRGTSPQGQFKPLFVCFNQYLQPEGSGQAIILIPASVPFSWDICLRPADRNSRTTLTKHRRPLTWLSQHIKLDPMNVSHSVPTVISQQSASRVTQVLLSLLLPSSRGMLLVFHDLHRPKCPSDRDISHARVGVIHLRHIPETQWA